MRKVRIAMTADTYLEPTGIINLEKAPFSPRPLVEVIAALGAIPVILPDIENADGKDYVDLFDGLIIPGGPDVDPELFGEEPLWSLGRVNYKRDYFEKVLIEATVAAKKPLFGICKGCQIINIALGGDVYQDLRTQCPSAYIQHSQKAPGGHPVHYVTMVEGSVLQRVLGDKIKVNSRHHQALRKVADGLRVTAQSEDGVIEGLENGDGSIVAVQWHPENMWQAYEPMKNLFADFIARVEASISK